MEAVIDELLTHEQLTKLTGSPQKSRQIVWLREQGIAFRVKLTGHPSVTWSAVNGNKQAQTERVWQPKALGL